MSDLFAKSPPRVSFEFFPPATAEAEEKWWKTIEWLAPLDPVFVSVTYGAGGTTRTGTKQALARLLEKTKLTPAAHLTSIGATRNELDALAAEFWEMGVRHIVALRGDQPAGGPYRMIGESYAYASDLVAGLKKVAPFEISVAAYPETHPHALSPQADLDYLKRKVDAGADRAISQFFFDVELFLRFRDRVAAAGITVPLVPGILPVTNFGQLKRFAAMCGASVPDWLAGLFEGMDGNPELRGLIAASVAAEQCRLLRAAGVEEFHFYTLNRAKLTVALCHILGIRSPHSAVPPRDVETLAMEAG